MRLNKNNKDTQSAIRKAVKSGAALGGLLAALTGGTGCGVEQDVMVLDITDASLNAASEFEDDDAMGGDIAEEDDINGAEAPMQNGELPETDPVTNCGNEIVEELDAEVVMGAMIDYEALDSHRKFTKQALEREARQRMENFPSMRKNAKSNRADTKAKNFKSPDDIEVYVELEDNEEADK